MRAKAEHGPHSWYEASWREISLGIKIAKNEPS